MFKIFVLRTSQYFSSIHIAGFYDPINDNHAVHKNVFAVKELAPQLCPSRICTSDFLCGILLLRGFVRLFFSNYIVYYTLTRRDAFSLKMEEVPLDDYAPLPTSPERNIADSPPANPQTQMESNLGVDDLGVDTAIDTRRQTQPRPKLDSERLLGDAGLPVLRNFVGRVQFKGKGHEKRDLTKLLSAYQIWGHQLFPKANFEDILAMCRRTGNDRDVRSWRQTALENEMYGKGDKEDLPSYPASPRSPVAETRPEKDSNVPASSEGIKVASEPDNLANLFTSDELEAAQDIQARTGKDSDETHLTTRHESRENNQHSERDGDGHGDGNEDEDEDEVAAAMEIYNDLGL